MTISLVWVAPAVAVAAQRFGESYPWRVPADIQNLAALRQRIRIEEEALREATDCA